MQNSVQSDGNDEIEDKMNDYPGDNQILKQVAPVLLEDDHLDHHAQGDACESSVSTSASPLTPTRA